MLLKGLPFLFDNKNVSMGLDAAGNGWVECEGVWAADAQRYQLYLVLPPQGAGGSGPRVQVCMHSFKTWPSLSASAPASSARQCLPYAHA